MELSRSQLEQIAASPQTFLRQGHKLNTRIAIKERRIEQLRRVSVQITTSLKQTSAYTGPQDKIGNCAVQIVALTEEIKEEADELAGIQLLIGFAIRELVSDKTAAAVLEARYLAEMCWEEIAVSFHYAFRHTLRIHTKGLAMMKEGAYAALRRLDGEAL